jgi:hypothetical protein
MLDLQENVAKVLSATTDLRSRLVDDAVREYFGTLDVLGSPGRSDFEAAEARAYAVLKRDLLAPDAITLIAGGTKLDDDSASLLALGFEGLSRPLRIPGPTTGAETKAITPAIAAAIGAVAGMLLLAPLLRLTLDMRDLGLVLGGPLGALLAVLVVHRLARLRFVARALPWLFVRPKALRGPARRDHEKAVRACVKQWVDWAVPMLAILCQWQTGRQEATTDTDKALRRIAKLVYALHRTPAESLPVVAHELIQEAKNSGFEGLEGSPAFLEAGAEEQKTLIWRQDLQSQYETFGQVDEGDRVTVERPAVVLGGTIVQRGLVRKVRDRT